MEVSVIGDVRFDKHSLIYLAMKYSGSIVYMFLRYLVQLIIVDPPPNNPKKMRIGSIYEAGKRNLLVFASKRKKKNNLDPDTQKQVMTLLVAILVICFLFW